MEGIAEHDQEIKLRYSACTDQFIFDSLPGAGPVFTPRLLTAFGENRTRYENASEMQRYARIAPVLERSGKKSWTHWRYSCPKFMRQSFVEWAGESVSFRFGQRRITNKKKRKESPIKPSLDAKPLSGYGSFIAAGRTKDRTMNRLI